MILGVHCSVRGGYLAALEEAVGLGCGAMQMLPYPRHHEPSLEELEAFRSARASSRVSRLLIHSRYVPFLASADPDRGLRSAGHLARELGLAAALGGEALVLHAGAHSPGEEPSRGMDRFAKRARAAMDRCGRPLRLLLENVPGGGRRMGGSLEELARLGERLRRRGVPIGFCLDTAHAWAQGYDIASAEGMWRFLEAAHRLLGASEIRAFHLSDTRVLLGSHREHHWHWGRGRLGTQGLEHLLGRAEFREAAGILETPKGELERGDLELVRGLQGGARPRDGGD